MMWYIIKNFYINPMQTSIKKFLLQEEYNAMDITSVIANQNYSRTKNTLAVHCDGSIIDAAILMTDYGKISPYFASDFNFRGCFVEELANIFGNRLFVHTSVSGKTEAVNIIIDNFSMGRKTYTIPYYIMTLSKEKFAEHSEIPGLSVFKGIPFDLIKLYHLQKLYEKKEVLLNPDYFNKWETLRHLQDILKNQVCFYGKYGKKTVSKANTNGQGFNYDQLGGVFTLPEYQKKGIAKVTVGALCREILFSKGKNISLFVKESNSSAIKLYTSLGFEIKNSFKSVYFL